MRKSCLFIGVIIGLLAAPLLVLFAQDSNSRAKDVEIRRMLELTGMQKLMDQMKSQMIANMHGQFKGLPDGFWDRLEKKMDVNELVEKIIPLYEKYYSLEDLRAVNAFYSSDVGKRMLATLPKITKESMAIGMEWGKHIGAEAEKEAKAELDKKNAEK